MDLSINGQDIAVLDCPGTGGWHDFKHEEPVVAYLVPGTNYIRLTVSANQKHLVGSPTVIVRCIYPFCDLFTYAPVNNDL